MERGCRGLSPKERSHIYLEGALQTRKWTDQSGVERYSTEIVMQRFGGVLTMLDGKGGGERAGARRDDTGDERELVGADAGGGQGARRPPGPDLDDEVPF